MKIKHKNIKCHSNSEKVVNRARAYGKKSENMWKGEREHMQKSGTLEKTLETGNKYKCRKCNMWKNN